MTLAADGRHIYFGTALMVLEFVIGELVIDLRLVQKNVRRLLGGPSFRREEL